MRSIVTLCVAAVSLSGGVEGRARADTPAELVSTTLVWDGANHVTNPDLIRFGRLERRNAQSARRCMVEAIERTTGSRFPESERAQLVGDMDELTLVNSGLEETMINAFHEILEARRREPRIPDLRTAAFVIAIEKVARTYIELGVFP